MVWFRVDDGFAFHVKTVEAGNAAVGLWVRAGAWCGQQLTDGLIPHAVARTMGKPSEIKALVDAGLWLKEGDFYRFHDFFQANPSRKDVEAERDRQRRKKDAWRKKKDDLERETAGQGDVSTRYSTGESTGSSTGESTGSSTGESRVPRPDPTRTSSSVPKGTGRRAASTTPKTEPAEDNAGVIVGAWIDTLNRRPPGQIVGQVAKTIRTLLAEDFTAEQIGQGLALMTEKGLNPSTLPSLVNEVVNRRTNVTPIKPYVPQHEWEMPRQPRSSS